MSIRLEDMSRICENYKNVRKKVVSVLGKDMLNSNHYGSTILYNETINMNTSPEKIIEINDKYLEIITKIKDYFNKNNVPLKNEYFDWHHHGGIRCFLGDTIDINKGFNELEPTIKDFIELYKRIDALSSKYANIDEIMFITTKGWESRNYWLYKEQIEYSAEDSVIENILNSYDSITQKVNEALKICKYKKKNIVIPKGNFRYSLFGQVIQLDTPIDKIIEIINEAQLFESNVKCALKELNIIARYVIKYDNSATVWFGEMGDNFSISASYNEIKNRFMETDKYHHFKKSDNQNKGEKDLGKTSKKPEAVNMKKCPKCELNYIKENEELCNVCYSASTLTKHKIKEPSVYFMPEHILERKFLEYLEEAGYKMFTPSGLPSTAFQYVEAIKKVMCNEGVGWEELVVEIIKIVNKYDKHGSKASFGKFGHSTVINALKRFREFVYFKISKNKK